MLPFVLLMQATSLPSTSVLPSPFWAQADALCTDVARIEAPDEAALGEVAAARDELVHYCKFTNAPRFAARSDHERREILARVARAAGASLVEPALAAVAQAPPADVARVAREEVRREPSPELGLIGEKILGASLSSLCGSADVKNVLRATCTVGDGPSLSALRLAIVIDVLDVLARRAGEGGPTAVKLVGLVLTPGDLRAPPSEVERRLTPECRADDGCAAVQRAGRLAARALARLLEDGPTLDRDKEHYRRVVEVIASKESGAVPHALSSPANEAVDALVVALRASDEERRLTVHATPTALSLKVLVAATKALALGAMLSAELGGADAVRASAFVVGLVQEHAAAIETTLAWLEPAMKAAPLPLVTATRPIMEDLVRRGKLTVGQVRAIEVAARLSAAKSEGELKTVLRDALLPLPPWVDRFALDLNISPPVNKRAQGESHLSLNGDVTVGYNGEVFGFVAHADTAYYDLASQGNSALTERYAGSLDTWALIPLGRIVKLEPRLSLGGSYYGTLADDTAAGIHRQTNQDSIFGRGSGLLGVRVEPGSRVALAAAFGVGAQYEDYFRVIQTSLGDQGTTFNQALTTRFEGRLRVQITVVPRILSFRARGDVNHFEYRRSDQAVTFSLGKVTQAEQGVTEVAQTEIFARGFLDADVARFFGFVPAVHAGANVFLLTSGGQSTSAIVPIVGIGIRREAL